MKHYIVIDKDNYDVRTFNTLEQVQVYIDDYTGDMNDLMVVHGNKYKIKRRIDLISDEEAD